MRIVLLGAATSIHIKRWYRAFVERGHAVVLATQHPDPGLVAFGGGSIEVLPFSGACGYGANAAALTRLVRRYRPDIVNAHYASGYGWTAAISRAAPTLTSVWGSDVYDFPYQSWIKRRLIRWNLERADAIASTSQTMARQVERLVDRPGPTFVTPFGVDCERFRTEPQRALRTFAIGSVKTLASKYGIDTLIRAFSALVSDPRVKVVDDVRALRLVLVGDGPARAELIDLGTRLGVASRIEFVGPVPHEDVPRWLNEFEIFVAPSRLDSESFGVAAVEASACGVPVVVSDAGGLPEVVRHGETGLVVRRDDPAALTDALVKLVLDESLRRRMGAAGRNVVLHEYEWGRSVEVMLDCYRRVLELSASRQSSRSGQG